jgi:hypothetical protein
MLFAHTVADSAAARCALARTRAADAHCGRRAARESRCESGRGVRCVRCVVHYIGIHSSPPYAQAAEAHDVIDVLREHVVAAALVCVGVCHAPSVCLCMCAHTCVCTERAHARPVAV